VRIHSCVLLVQHFDDITLVEHLYLTVHFIGWEIISAFVLNGLAKLIRKNAATAGFTDLMCVYSTLAVRFNIFLLWRSV
jgi:hypothetical protein